MSATPAIRQSINSFGRASALPANFLNCYEIKNISRLEWPVSIYIVKRADQQQQAHEDRSEIKGVVFDLRLKHRDKCKGFGFCFDVDEESVVVPASWEIPDTTDYKGFNVTLSHTFVAKASNPSHRAIISGIIREGVKKHFKDNPVSEELGALWQDYNSFCQMPSGSSESGYSMCRRFGTLVKTFRGNRWVLECLVNTATLDGRTLADYYRRGEIEILAEMIDAKRYNRSTRKNRPPEIRVWRDQSTEYTTAATVLELEYPDVIIEHSKLSPTEQRKLNIKDARCRVFARPSIDVPLADLRLVLDAYITGENHADTILDPDEREGLVRRMRDFLNGAEIFGQPLLLAESPFDADSLPNIVIAPPALRVRGAGGVETIIETPVMDTEASLRIRAKERSNFVRRYGFLQHRSITPAIAYPQHLGERPARRLKKDLNRILELQGIDFRFEFFLYRNVDDIRREAERRGYNALFVVLPESSRRGYRPDDTHERVKQRVEVPSQCMHFDNGLPYEWVNKPYREFRSAKPNQARRVQQTYEACISNLLVKHGWVPFAPAEPFYNNVHVGIDVGGRHNTHAVACLGYGFRQPQNGLLFRPEDIPIDVQQAEPIPTQYLFRGLLNLFEFVHSELSAANVHPDFENTLFIRDGALLGAGNEWNEREALHQLHSLLLDRGWVSPNSIWTSVETLKHAEGLRLLRNERGVTNPLSGKCVFPFDDDNEALICTTGAPYIKQGTAAPIMVRIVDIHGHAVRSEVIRDLLWEADMSFTKHDMVRRLPWVLNVADTGALQKSRSYRVSGITV